MAMMTERQAAARRADERRRAAARRRGDQAARARWGEAGRAALRRLAIDDGGEAAWAEDDGGWYVAGDEADIRAAQAAGAIGRADPADGEPGYWLADMSGAAVRYVARYGR